LPKETGTIDGISYQLNDSLLLTRQLFPELLTLSRNKFMWKDVLNSAVNLLDSNMISIEMVKPIEKDLLFHIDTLLSGTASKEEGFWGWSYINLVHLAGKLNTTASNAALQKVTAINSLDLKEEAITRLLENNQSVDAKEIEKLAASNEYRLSFYHSLEKINKLSFFPAKYKTQRWFAEAELYGYDEEDYFPETMELVAEKEAIFDGKKQRFFLFKLQYQGEDTYTWGIAGPYDLDSKNLETTNDVTLIDYDEEEFDKKKINQQFEKFLKQGEENLIQRKEWEKKNE